ncbi:MAG: DUF47 family protein [Cyanobacteria bacterium SIG30]|nr:DUF47 family protein [Cyanobacteria bacterium SIG30]
MGKFNLLSYIMPPEDKLFFMHFQDSSQTCLKSAKLYDEIMRSTFDEKAKENALGLKKKGKVSYKAVLKQLNKSFITPLEREDIQIIAVQLNKINKKIIKACLLLEVYMINNYTDEMKEQASTLVKATNKLSEIVSRFKKVSDTNEMTQLNIEMKEIEAHGDEIHRRAMHDLFSGKYEALDVIKLRDMYKEIEGALDACYFVTDTILNVVLKQS